MVLLAYDHRRRPAPAGWLDGLMVGLASAAVAAALVLAPMLRRDPSTSAQAITHLAYPAADLTLLIVLIVLGTVGGVTRPRVDPRLALLAAGLGLHLVTDLTYLLLDPAGHDRDGGPVALGWLSAVAVLATAACHRETTRHPDRDTPAEPDGSTTRWHRRCPDSPPSPSWWPDAAPPSPRPQANSPPPVCSSPCSAPR